MTDSTPHSGLDELRALEQWAFAHPDHLCNGLCPDEDPPSDHSPGMASRDPECEWCQRIDLFHGLFEQLAYSESRADEAVTERQKWEQETHRLEEQKALALVVAYDDAVIEWDTTRAADVGHAEKIRLSDRATELNKQAFPAAREALAAVSSPARKLQHNPEPLKVTEATHRCSKCRAFAPRCTCWDGPDYQPLDPSEAQSPASRQEDQDV